VRDEADHVRIDVDAPADDGLAYAIPSDNPFAGNDHGWREEIWAYGLRNPWRFSFDFETGRLWLADVGQEDIEEVNLIIPGGNYGWPIKEGTRCGLPPQPGEPACDDPGLIDPIWEYVHPPTGGASITGGFVYRGSVIPQLVGRYVYADFMFGHVWALTYEDGSDPENELLLITDQRITSFGVDPDGELLAATFAGRIKRLVAQDVGAEEVSASAGWELRLAGPNPVLVSSAVEVTSPGPAHVRILLVDLLGREVATLFDDRVSIGSTTVRLDAAGLSSGTYVARLVADGQPAGTIRLTVLR
jgi:hypothetical protein